MSKKKPQLHELLAVEGDLGNTAKAMMEEAAVTFHKKPEHFRGQNRTVKYYDDTRSQENEEDNKPMVTTVDDKLAYTRKYIENLVDAILQKEEANQRARADLSVDGVTFGTNLPATFLLGMESRLKAVQQMILTIPTLDPNMNWTEVPAEGEGVFKSDPLVTKRTEKAVRHKVLYDATDKHPAQIEKWNEDVPVAAITTIHRSGMWTPARKAATLGRLDKLIRSVKKARQRANTTEVEDLHVAKAMLDYVFN